MTLRRELPMTWKIEDGTARAAVYPEGPHGEPWVPRDDQHDNMGFDPLPSNGPTIAQVHKIKHVESVDSCGAQGFHVVVKARDSTELTKAVAHVKEQLARMFAKCQ